MVQHTTHDWPTTAELNSPRSTRNLASPDELDDGNDLDTTSQEGTMAGLASGEIKPSRKTRKLMGLL